MNNRQSINFGILLGKGVPAKQAFAIVMRGHPRRKKYDPNQLSFQLVPLSKEPKPNRNTA